MSEVIGSQGLKLGTLVIEVPDVETLDKCTAWYQELGLPRMPNLDQPGESYWFDVGNDVLLGIHIGAVSPPTGFTLYLNVSNVDELYARLSTRGSAFESEPETKFWGRSARLKDPAGTAVRLVSPS